MTIMDPKDLDGQPLDLLIKILRMTESENDHLALTAVRRANSHLAKLGASWDDLLRGRVRIIADPFASINISQAAVNPNRNQPFSPPPPPPRGPISPIPTAPPQHHPASPRAQTATPPRPKAQPQQPQQPTAMKPAPGSPALAGDTLERTIVNRFEGTCPKCKNRVPIGEGLAQQYKNHVLGRDYWITEHALGKCGPIRTRDAAVTPDNFTV